MFAIGHRVAPTRRYRDSRITVTIWWISLLFILLAIAYHKARLHLNSDPARCSLALHTYLRSLTPASYVVEIAKHRFSYVSYVGFKEKRKRNKDCQGNPKYPYTFLFYYVYYVSALTNTGFEYVKSYVKDT